jgi:hypothetical protein
MCEEDGAEILQSYVSFQCTPTSKRAFFYFKVPTLHSLVLLIIISRISE